MNKAEFVDKLAEKGKTTKKLATEAIELGFSTIGETLLGQPSHPLLRGCQYEFNSDERFLAKIMFQERIIPNSGSVC